MGAAIPGWVRFRMHAAGLCPRPVCDRRHARSAARSGSANGGDPAHRSSPDRPAAGGARKCRSRRNRRRGGGPGGARTIESAVAGLARADGDPGQSDHAGVSGHRERRGAEPHVSPPRAADRHHGPGPDRTGDDAARGRRGGGVPRPAAVPCDERHRAVSRSRASPGQPAVDRDGRRRAGKAGHADRGGRRGSADGARPYSADQNVRRRSRLSGRTEVRRAIAEPAELWPKCSFR